jgi:DNA polymerase-3 subunit alpha (Gram-positive type)
MCLGKTALEKNLKELRGLEKPSNKEKDQIGDMRIVQEMYARGFEFAPIDVYKAHSRHFQIIDGKLMPALTTIEGMGEKAADAVMEAAKDGPFLSRDDFRDRTKVSQTTIDTMVRLGLLEGLPESNQISLFDFM